MQGNHIVRFDLRGKHLDRESIQVVLFVCAIISALSLTLIAVNVEKIAKELKRRNDRDG